MTIQILKPATKSPATGEDDTRETVQKMLHEIEQGGEDCVKEYAANSTAGKRTSWSVGMKLIRRARR